MGWSSPSSSYVQHFALQNDILLFFVSYNVIKDLGEISNLESVF